MISHVMWFIIWRHAQLGEVWSCFQRRILVLGSLERPIRKSGFSKRGQGLNYSDNKTTLCSMYKGTLLKVYWVVYEYLCALVSGFVLVIGFCCVDQDYVIEMLMRIRDRSCIFLSFYQFVCHSFSLMNVIRNFTYEWT